MEKVCASNRTKDSTIAKLQQEKENLEMKLLQHGCGASEYVDERCDIYAGRVVDCQPHSSHPMKLVLNRLDRPSGNVTVGASEREFDA